MTLHPPAPHPARKAPHATPAAQGQRGPQPLRSLKYSEQAARLRPKRPAADVPKADVHAEPVAHAAGHAAGTPVQHLQPGQLFATEDPFNKSQVSNNTGKGNHRRPGIQVGKQIDFPVRHEAEVLAGDLHTSIGNLHAGETVRANPATSRTHEGKRYIMVWARNHGGGWIAADAVEHGQAIAHKAARLASWQPDKSGHQGKLCHFRQPAAYVAPHGPGLGTHLNPHQKTTGGLIEHHGLRAKGWATPVYNVFLSLPQSDAAAVARDIALPGNSFRVIAEREVPTYATAGSIPKAPVVFCYGYVSGDPKRRGWVMKACLA
jgi:hypothetical protein